MLHRAPLFTFLILPGIHRIHMINSKPVRSNVQNVRKNNSNNVDEETKASESNDNYEKMWKRGMELQPGIWGREISEEHKGIPTGLSSQQEKELIEILRRLTARLSRPETGQQKNHPELDQRSIISEGKDITQRLKRFSDMIKQIGIWGRSADKKEYIAKVRDRLQARVTKSDAMALLRNRRSLDTLTEAGGFAEGKSNRNRGMAKFENTAGYLEQRHHQAGLWGKRGPKAELWHKRRKQVGNWGKSLREDRSPKGMWGRNMRATNCEKTAGYLKRRSEESLERQHQAGFWGKRKHKANFSEKPKPKTGLWGKRIHQAGIWGKRHGKKSMAKYLLEGRKLLELELDLLKAISE